MDETHHAYYLLEERVICYFPIHTIDPYHKYYDLRRSRESSSSRSRSKSKKQNHDVHHIESLQINTMK